MTELYTCEACGAEYVSPAAALECELEDDRAYGRNTD